MITLSRLFARLTPRGRREARAQRWDAIADRAAARHNLYSLATSSSGLMAVPLHTEQHFRQRLQETKLAERNARERAAAIRRGER